ncbi:E3 ubiquitin-protein ligase TRAIP [Orchesella cincta]|uniref:E3 ubiquitin-protein ligase TRAIP n=1 Tax=Orchesella cincta TaxID=48709 RepID=A0A1D2MU54_ORCCI|nr:E3 ubiquitin-protein ligase TRAIP [Orchesella cincta]
MGTNTNSKIICCICREALINDDESGALTVSSRCGHAFHSDCISAWFQHNAHRYGEVNGCLVCTCPVCNIHFRLHDGIQLFLSTAEGSESSTTLEKLEGELEVAKKEARILSSEVASLSTKTQSLMAKNKSLKAITRLQNGAINDLKTMTHSQREEINSLQRENRYLKLRRQSLEKAVADAQTTSSINQMSQRYTLVTEMKSEVNVEPSGSSLKIGPCHSKIDGNDFRTKIKKKNNSSLPKKTGGAGPTSYSGPITRSRSCKQC